MQAAVAARQRAEAAQAQAEAAARKLEIDRQQAAAEAAAEARVKRDIAVREQTHKAAEAAQLAAENSPENHCRQPDFARMIISEFNQFKPMKALDEQVVDIEHITTSKYDVVGSDIICHGIFITTGGRRMVGSVEMRKNVAGDPIILWKRER